MGKSILDGDKLNQVPRRATANAAMQVVDAMQSHHKEVQIVGAAASFIMMCERYQIDPGEAFRIAARVMKNTDHILRPEFSAVRAYMEHELT